MDDLKTIDNLKQFPVWDFKISQDAKDFLIWDCEIHTLFELLMTEPEVLQMAEWFKLAWEDINADTPLANEVINFVQRNNDTIEKILNNQK